MDGPAGNALLEMNEYHYGKRWLLMEGTPELLFTDNETNMERLFQQKSRTPYVKDAFHRYVIGGETRGGESGDEGDESRRALRRGNRRRQGKDDSPSPDGPQSRRRPSARTEVFRRAVRHSYSISA